ncbi:MAG TPA: discoidin domain-containing protein [Candidatus Paceibacterota bacterium]|nr:discoidin domain-containing protein [Candidatus Paceibacterota bacterium]
MNPLRILYADLAKSCAVTDSTEATGYPGTNVQHPHLSRAWRTSALAAQWIIFDAGAGNTISFDTAAIVGHNLTAAAVVKVQSDDTPTWAPPGGVDKNADPTQPLMVVDVAPLPTARRYVRVYIDDPTNPAGYISIGRIMLGIRFEGETIDRGFKIAIEDSTVLSASLSGQIFADLGVQQRVYSMSLGTMKNATKQKLIVIVQTAGQYDPVVVIPSESSIPGAVGETEAIMPLYATMTKGVSFTEQGGWGWADDVISFREAL